MAQHGGHRTPANPAPVSGPGALSQRTDGRTSAAAEELSSGAYGDRKDLTELLGSQPLRERSGSQGVFNPEARLDRAQVVALSADSQRPDEPVTAGSPLGDGVGPVAAGIDVRDINQQDAAEMRKYLPMLEYLANRDGASPSTKAFIRRIKGNL